MTIGKYRNFSNRLIEAMIAGGHATSRSPSGICMKTLAHFSGASEQICRRYVRGDALPDYDKIIGIAAHLKVSPGWLLFGEQSPSGVSHQAGHIDDDLMTYILSKTGLYIHETNAYVDFVMRIIREIREIDTTKENLERIVNLALDSIVTYTDKPSRSVIKQKVNAYD